MPDRNLPPVSEALALLDRLCRTMDQTELGMPPVGFMNWTTEQRDQRKVKQLQMVFGYFIAWHDPVDFSGLPDCPILRVLSALRANTDTWPWS